MAFYLTMDEGHEINIFADFWARAEAISHKWLYIESSGLESGVEIVQIYTKNRKNLINFFWIFKKILVFPRFYPYKTGNYHGDNQSQDPEKVVVLVHRLIFIINLSSVLSFSHKIPNFLSYFTYRCACYKIEFSMDRFLSVFFLLNKGFLLVTYF